MPSVFLSFSWGGVFLRSGVLVLRPRVLTFALLAVLLAELAAFETGRRRHLWLLPPLFVLWVNLNLTVLIGGLCLAVFALDRLLKGKLDRHLITISALSAAALLVNPRGPFLLEAALKYRDSDALRYQYVFEWMEPELGDVTHLPFLFALPVVPRALWAPGLAALAVAVVVTVALRTDASQFRRDPIAVGFPTQATTILMEQYPHARLFNVYDYGGYLPHRFDGENRVFSDGREKMYGDDHLRYYFNLIYGEPGWQEAFDREGVDAVLIRHIDGLSDEIENAPA